jgi:hypothetical protein
MRIELASYTTKGISLLIDFHDYISLLYVWNIGFRRTFGTEETATWGELKASLPPVSRLQRIVCKGG